MRETSCGIAAFANYISHDSLRCDDCIKMCYDRRFCKNLGH